MKPDTRHLTIALALAVFIGLPLLFYTLGDAPRRSVLKETLSVVTFLAFGLLIGQFFLARSNQAVLALFKAPMVQKVHKYLAYGAISVMVLHPFLIVLPRYLEGGIKPWQAFWAMVTTFDSLGIILGLAAWGTMLTIAVTAFFRMSLMKQFANRYRGWRYFHGGLAVVFTVLGVWHAIELGRHTDTALGGFYIAIATLGIGMLARLYWAARPQKTAPQSMPEGAR